MGVDAKVGIEVEKRRTKRRCCNYIIYALLGLLEIVRPTQEAVAHQVKRIVSSKKMDNGAVRHKVVADMSKVGKSPFNIVGTNLSQGFGGYLSQTTWHKS